MNICPITYKETENIYSHEGLKLLSPKLTTLNALYYTAEEQRIEAIRCVSYINYKRTL